MVERVNFSLDDIARLEAPETILLGKAPAVFEARDGRKTIGKATVSITRPTIAIRFEADALNVDKAAYGETNGMITAADGSWTAPGVNDAGAAINGDRLFNTLSVITANASSSKVHAMRLVLAGAAWSGTAEIADQRYVLQTLSVDTVSHHDQRMAISVDASLDEIAIDCIQRACAFIGGLDVEILRIEFYSKDGTLVRVKHHRGYRRVGRGPHSPFTGVPDAHRMRAWAALVEAMPQLMTKGVPVDKIIDQISAHNQVSQIHVGSELLILSIVTAAYHRMHGDILVEGAASRRDELALLNKEIKLGLSDEDLDRYERLRVELLDAGYFHAPGYETGRPQRDIKFLRDLAHVIVFRMCGYTGPFYGAERFATQELAEAK